MSLECLKIHNSVSNNRNVVINQAMLRASPPPGILTRYDSTRGGESNMRHVISSPENCTFKRFITVGFDLDIVGFFSKEFLFLWVLGITQTCPCNKLQYFTAVKIIIFR